MRDHAAALRRYEARQTGRGTAAGAVTPPRPSFPPPPPPAPATGCTERRTAPVREPVEPVEATTPDGRRRAVLVLPWPTPPLTLNARLAWPAMNRARQGIAEVISWTVRGVHPFDRPVEVELIRYLGDRSIADADNLAGTMKPTLDGMVAARVLPADDAATVVRTSQRVIPAVHDPLGPGHPRLLLVITEARPDEFEHYGETGEAARWA